MPITITIPTQQQLLQMQQDPGSLLAVYNAAHAAKPAPGSAAATNVPGVAPGSTTTSPSIVTPVQVPEYKPADLPQINYTPQNNADWIKATSDMINQINQRAQQQANAGRIPGGQGLESKSSQNINSALSGNLPDDVLYQIGQAAAQRGVAGGNQYGANTNADYLRALGLNSLQLQDTGQNWLTAALARNPAAPIYDPSKLLITPTQATGFNLDQANLALNQQRAASEVSNANAQRQLQSDLANADTQFKRDQLVWQYEQNRLQRENALRIAEMEMARRGYGGGSSGYRNPSGGNVAGNFAPATNWSAGTTTTSPWNLPQQGGGITDSEWNDMLYGYPGEDLTPSGSPPSGTYYNPNTNTSDYNPLGNYYGNGIDQGGMTQDELDWLYNVGG